MDKRIERIADKSIAINVNTKKEYNDLMKFFERKGIKWCDGDDATSYNVLDFNGYAEDTIIFVRTMPVIKRYVITHDRMRKMKDGTRVISFQEFIKKEDSFTKADLKDGDIVTLRNGEKGTCKKQFDKITIGSLSNAHINDDLTNNGALGKELDIIKVERPLGYETVYERKEEILDETEKSYLKGVIEPFRNEIVFIKKKMSFLDGEPEYIAIKFKNDSMTFPNFEKNTMYKSMKLEKEYTLEELGL